MFSKQKLQKWALMPVLSLALVSCSYHLGEAPPEAPSEKIQATGCLSGVLPVVKDYGAGKASSAEVSGAWDCAITAVEKFKKYVRGRSVDRYTSVEIADFLEKNFIDQNKNSSISPELRQQFMKFKQLFVGGSDQDLTRDEIDKTLTVFTRLKAISIELNPYMKVLAQHWSITDSRDVSGDIRYFENAADEIKKAAMEFAPLIAANQQSYQLEDFVSFLQNLQEFSGETWQLTDDVAKYMPVIEKVKKAIAGGDQASVAPQEWQNFVLIGVRGYLQYLRYYYFIKSTPDSGSGLRLGYLARSVEDLLGAFQDLLNGKPTDPSCGTSKTGPISCISKQDIRELLMTFSEVWTQFKVSDTLIDQGMKLKQVYFGGDLQSLTSQDFARGKNKVGALRLIVEKFLPYYSLYSKDWDRSGMDAAAAQSFFSDAQKSLISSASDLGPLFESSYDLQDLSVLLTEVHHLYPNPQNPNQDGATETLKYLPLTRDVKNIVFSENDTIIKKNEWGPLLTFASRFYGAYLFDHYFVSGHQAGTVQFLNTFKALSDNVLGIVGDLLKYKQGQTITRAELEMLTQRLVELNLLPKQLDPNSVDQLIRAVLGRLLWPAEARISGRRAPDGLTLQSVETARNELEIWYQTEAFTLGLVSQGSAQGVIAPKDLQRAVAKKLTERSLNPALKTGLEEFSLMISGPIAQTVDARGHLVIGAGTPKYDGRSLSNLNLNRAIGRVLIRAVSTDLQRLKKNQGVTLEEAQAFFNPIRPFLVELNIIDPENTTFIESRFRDASIFVAHANGNTDLANFQQVADLVGMISSGMTIDGPFQKDVTSACLGRGIAVTATTTVPLACLRKVYIHHLMTDMSATPDFERYYLRLGNDDRGFYFTGVLKAAGYEGGPNVKLNDAALLPHVVQYIEMIFARFDADHNGEINTQEAINAFPLFHGLLSQLTKDQSLIKDADLEALFTYILYYGKPPGGLQDFLFKWLPWKWHPENWKLATDRTQLAGILGYISDQASKANKKSEILTPEEEAKLKQDPNYKNIYDHPEYLYVN